MASSASSKDDRVLDVIFNPDEPILGLGLESDADVGDCVGGVSSEEVKHAQLLELQAVKVAEGGDLVGALELLNEAVTEVPGYASVYNNRAQVYRLLNQVDLALADLDEAIRLSNDRGKVAEQAFTQRGLIRRLRGEDEGALADFKSAAHLGSRFARKQGCAGAEYYLSDDDEDGNDHPDNTAAAYVTTTKMWRRKTALRVYFMDEQILENWSVDRATMNVDNILGWAAEWNTQLAPNIPKFIKEDVIEMADIRVSFGRGASCWSKVGTDAKNLRGTAPTMNLTLNNFPPDFQRYLVIHEFGHVLGLQHEHQRSDFWKAGSKYLDVKKMERDRRMKFTDFVVDILQLSYKGDMSTYDPDSIMHYWFDVRWLKDKYKKYQNRCHVQQCKKLTEKQRKFLLGIHSNNGSSFAQRPSQTDLLFLQNCYSSRDLPDSDSGSFQPSLQGLASSQTLKDCTECSPDQIQHIQLVRKQLKHINMIRNIDKDSVNTVSQGALLDYIDNYTKVCSPDFNHLKSHLESLQLQERLDSCVLELALKHVDEKKDEKNGKEPLFCKDVVYHASLCCLAVNTCDSMSSLQMFLSDKKRVSGHCFQEVSLSHSKQEHSKQERYLIARQGESTYYIALQGISDIREWLKYRSFKEGITAQINSFPVQFIVDLLAGKINRVVLTGFSFGGLLASSITAKVWQSPSLGWKHMQESLVCISFAQPHLPVPELDIIAQESPLIARSIHLIYYEQDKIPLVVSLFDKKCSALLVETRTSEPGLKFSLHEEPGTAFEDPLTQKLIRQLGTLMNSGHELKRSLSEELEKSLAVISPMATQMRNAYSNHFTHYSLCTDCTTESGLTFNKISKQEVRTCFTVEDVDALLNNHSKHSMVVYADKLTRGYLNKSSNYTIPDNHIIPQSVRKLQPVLTEVQLAEYSSNLCLTLFGDNLWFCEKFEIEGIEFPVVLSASQFSIQSSLTGMDSSVLGDISNGEPLSITLHSQFGEPQVVESILHKKEYALTARQRHVEALKPSELIELSYLSALLERQPHGHFTDTTSFKATTIRKFIEEAQKVVPLESIGMCLTSQNKFVSETCAKVILTHGDNLPFSLPLCDLAEQTLSRARVSDGVGFNSPDRPLGTFEMISTLTENTCRASVDFLYPQCFPASPYKELMRVRSELEYRVKNDPAHPGDAMFDDVSTVLSDIKDLRQSTLAISVTLLGKYFESKKILVQHGALPKLHDLTADRKTELQKGDVEANQMESSLITPLKDQPYAAEIGYSFLLESRLAKHCKELGITQNYFLDTLIRSWKEKFKGYPLSLIVESSIPVVARWLKWCLMVNNLRREVYEKFPPAIGVVGLINSGKTKLVHSLFGIQTSSGTNENSRTTIPFVYNLKDTVGNVDIVDFPGVNDVDKSVFDVGNLILTLAQVIIFVVDYRDVASEASKSWLDTLQSKDVPMLVCLTYADKFYAEQMGNDSEHPEESKIKQALQRQLQTIRFRVKIPPCLDVKFCTFSQDKDSIFNNEKERERLRDVGMSTPKDVGHWIARTFEHRLGNSTLASDIRCFLDQNKGIF